MVSSRKRALRDAEPEPEPDTSAPATTQDAPEHASLLQRVRNTWQFANLFQWIFLFGKVVKIDDSLDIDVSFAPTYLAAIPRALLMLALDAGSRMFEAPVDRSR